MSEFPWGVFIILSCGLIFTAWIIYYILRLANEEIKDEHDTTHRSDSEGG
jgi:large-conductance mechanosensitive channel